jgi:purine-binding chemotaxis protein CheW
MEPPPSIVAGINSNYITAVGKLEDRLLILLDLDKILQQDEKEVLETVN